jgi:hypothetical protein
MIWYKVIYTSFAIGILRSYKLTKLCDDQSKSNEMPMKQRAICAVGSYWKYSIE